jgi:hypothetical protein
MRRSSKTEIEYYEKIVQGFCGYVAPSASENALKKNLSIEDIADITGMSRQEIEQLRTDNGMAAQ